LRIKGRWYKLPVFRRSRIFYFGKYGGVSGTALPWFHGVMTVKS
jgi:hypothetical protein